MAKRKKKSNSFSALIVLLLGAAAVWLYEQQPGSNAVGATSDLHVAQLTNGNGQLVEHKGYTLCYNNSTRNAHWVGYELTDEEAQGVVERGENFCCDPLVRGAQATDDDYRGSGWDRGHLAPAADMKWSKEAMDESFYLSNVSPQNRNLNRGVWKKLEELCRDKAELYGRVVIVTGPVFYNNHPKTIGKKRVAVPDAFFKVLLSDYNGTYRTIGFLMENKAGKKGLKEYAKSVDEIEEITGIDFFSALPDDTEERVEKAYSTAFWGI